MFFFPCSADHERDCPPCKVVFFGLAINTLNVRNNNSNNNTVALWLLPLGNPFEPCSDFVFITYVIRSILLLPCVMVY